MGGDEETGAPRRSAIPLVAGAIVTAQVTMAMATMLGDRLTLRGVGRKPLFLAGILSLPLRCALIIWWKDAGDAFLLSTQILDGLGAGLTGLIHPYLVADITFGTGRFNVLSESVLTFRTVYYSNTSPNQGSSFSRYFATVGVTASCFGLGATLSNFLGQMVVENFGHVTSLMGSLIISIIPIVLFTFMPETLGQRTQHHNHHQDCSGHHPNKLPSSPKDASVYRSMA